MKVGWEVRPLGEVCELVNGRAYKKPELLDRGKYPVLRVGNFFTSNKWYYSDLELQPKKYCDTGGLLYAWSASFGPRIWEGKKTIFHYHIWNVQHPEQLLDRKFLYYYFDWDKERIKEEQGAGATMIHVSKRSMEARALPIPPLEEQKRIVAVLDAAFEGLTRAKENAEANLQNARELFDEVAKSVFEHGETSWPHETLPNVCIDFGRGKSKHRPRNEPSLYGGAYPFLQTGDLSAQSHYVSDSKQTYSEKGLAQRKLWPSGTVCIAIVGATIGESAITAMPACFPDSIIGMVADDSKTQPEYIQHLLAYYKADLKAAGEGSARDNINLATFKDWEFPMPSISEQIDAVTKLNKANDLIQAMLAQYRTKLTDIEDLRQSLLQKAFAGELT